MAPSKHTIGIALRDEWRTSVFTAAQEEAFASLGTVLSWGDPASLQNALPDVDILITGWGLPRLDPAVLDTAPRLRLIAHIGAAVRPFVTPSVFARGIRVTQAGAGMARPVAEVALAMTLSLLHQIHRYDQAMRAEGRWPPAGSLGTQREILGTTIGVVGASRTGRAYISMAQRLGARVLLADPFVSPAQAATLGTELLALADMLPRCQIVCLHAPATPASRHILGPAELQLLADGAGLVNTARSWLVDQEALLAELRRGRIDAALDVYDEEPLPADHPFRSLPNVLLTPHQAAASVEGRLRQGSIIVEEVARFISGQRLVHEVLAEDLDRLA